MNISPISFGKKIPIAKCKVLDTQKQKSVDATFFEYDCKDHLDSIEVSYLSGRWAFKETIAIGMERKFRRHLRGKPPEADRFYGLQSSNGEILGLCNTSSFSSQTNIEYITRDLNTNYKYVGQMLLAQIAKQTLVDNKQQLVVRNPLDNNYDFYQKGCGFEFCDDYAYDMQMGREKMAKFIMDVEDKTNCSIF